MKTNLMENNYEYSYFTNAVRKSPKDEVSVNFWFLLIFLLLFQIFYFQVPRVGFQTIPILSCTL